MLPPPRLLIADDDHRVRALWIDILHHFHPDWHIHEAADDRRAYSLYQDHGADIIVTAHHLPAMNGIALITRLRAAGQQTPIVLVANDEPTRRDITLDTRTVFVARPARMHQLLTTMTDLLALDSTCDDRPQDRAVGDALQAQAFREVGRTRGPHARSGTD